MSCENCDCLDCRLERGEVDCDYFWEQADVRQEFGDFRCWVGAGGSMMFQYRTGYDEYEPITGEECCWQGTADIFTRSRVLRVCAERAGWRPPADLEALQDNYNTTCERLRADYNERIEQSISQVAELREALYQSNSALADLRQRLQASQDAQTGEMVSLTVLHEQGD